MLRPTETSVPQTQQDVDGSSVVNLLDYFRDRYWLNAATYDLDPENHDIYYGGSY